VPETAPRSDSVRVLFSRQIDAHSSLAPLGRNGDDLLDRFDGQTLVRTIALAPDGPLVPYSIVIPEEPTEVLDARLSADSGDSAGAAIAAAFVTETEALRDLCRSDPAVRALAERHPGLVPVLYRDPFQAIVRSISAQQINLRFAAVIRHRLALNYGTRLTVGSEFVHVLDADALAAASVEDLRALQLTYAKARAVVATARAATIGFLRQSLLEQMSDDEVIAHLTQLPGIGRWSAEWFLARTLGRPRVVAGDLGVRKAVGRLYEVGMPSEDETRRLTEHWGPAANVAQALALHDLALREPAARPARPPAP
jgi:DNA-3-methyladenine glycosylase II